MKPALGIVLGAACAAMIVACGGAQRPSTSPSTSPAAEAGAPPTSVDPLGSSPLAQIEALDQQIDADLASLDLARPAIPPDACIQPPCDLQPMAAAVKPPADDPTCKPGPSETCQDSCKLASSICTNAHRICDLAGQLGGNDAYANGKCASGSASCDAAKQRCCGCL